LVFTFDYVKLTLGSNKSKFTNFCVSSLVIEMKIRKYVSGAICATAIATGTFADSSANIMGTWKGISYAAVIGTDKHHLSESKDEVKFVQTPFTIVIDEVSGRTFSGYNFTVNHKETVAGAFRRDMKSGVLIDSNGTMAFEFLDNGQLEICYTHAKRLDEESGVAACIELERK
jgi:hypothetical protein